MKLSERLFLDKHHTIERFGVLFGVLFVSLVIVFISTCFSQVDFNENLLLTQSKWTTEFTFSLSGAKGSVVNVFRDDHNTKSFMLLKFEDLKDITIDPNEYEVFLTGSDMNQNWQELKCAPKASIYMFGNTGYMGLYFVDMGGFQPQICDLIIRSNKRVSMNEQESASAFADASFAEFDQAEIYFNPGGSDGLVSVALNENDMSAFSIYESMIAIGKEDAVKKRINSNLQAMYELQLHMDEYEMRVSNNGVVVPDAPLPIRNDVVNAPDENGYYSLTTDFVYNRGFDFDWANGSVRQGWLSDICPEGNYAVFFREHSKLEEDTPFNLADGTVKWYYLDGTTVDLNANDDIDGSAQTRKSINDLKQLWAAFNDLKTSYQIDLLQELLMLEVDARSIERNYSVAADMPITLY